VTDLYIDEPEKKLRMLEISAGGFFGLGARHILLPVDAITAIGKDEVHINQTLDHVVQSPTYDPSLIETSARVLGTVLRLLWPFAILEHRIHVSAVSNAV
jgi:hypothetical protein